MGKRDDVQLSEMIFKQTLREGIEIYSPSLLYLMAQQDTIDQQATNIINIIETIEEQTTEQTTEETTEEVIEAAITVTGTFTPVETPVAVYLEEQLKNPQFIKQTFYAEDATTYISENQLSYDKLIGYDATLKQTSDKPQILIYHTHSQEMYADSKAGDVSESIVGVGERLATILSGKYGFNVIHHLGQYDVESRDYAYSKAMEGISTLLENNPSIEVMIDLHRDETNADTRLVTTIQDKQMARFMFFNGLCYTRELGELQNLNNPYIQENLSFAFQMQLFADEYYPGLTRRIYLKGYRYNMHFRPKSLLIELGSQTNTVEEAMNTCEPIAHIIASVLKGENK
jgi:stage II sporulation protein P